MGSQHLLLTRCVRTCSCFTAFLVISTCFLVSATTVFFSFTSFLACFCSSVATFTAPEKGLATAGLTFFFFSSGLFQSLEATRMYLGTFGGPPFGLGPFHIHFPTWRNSVA